MLYAALHNEISEEFKNFPYDKTRILITKRYGTKDYSLRWDAEELWGQSYLNKEFVKYRRLRIYSELPEELNEMKEKILEDSSFEEKEGKIIVKDIGRFIFEINSKKIVLDVIFPHCSDRIFGYDLYREYTQGISGMRSPWRYDIFEASMAEFLMEIINLIPKDQRTFETTIRTIMAHFSSENSRNSLIEGKWGSGYEGGRNPTDWEYTAEIFRTRKRNNEPIKYGQCWVFAECMTSAMRFLGIPARTVYAKNSHINVSLSFAIDLYGYSNSEKGENPQEFYKKILDFQSFNSNEDKDGEDSKSLSNEVFVREDSIWNFHYWNEIYVPRDTTFSWECLDSSPMICTNEEPLRGKKILGPCSVLDIKNGNENKYDYRYLSAAVNSPFRIWTKTLVLVNNEPMFVSFVHSIVFPAYPEYSIISRKSALALHEKSVVLQTRINKVKDEKTVINITEEYTMSFEKIVENLYKNHPVFFFLNDKRLYMNYDPKDENIYSIQQLGITSRGIPILASKTECKLKDIQLLVLNPSIKFLSFLISKEEKFWPQLIEVF